MEKAGEIFIGTSGWSYPKGEGTWRGHFYPRGTANELAYYSSIFSVVEINSTFYRLPSAAMASSWAKKTPKDFKFSVKLWQKFTHPKMFKAQTGEDALISNADIEAFKEGIEPLKEAGKLAILLAQFPPSFYNNEANRKVLGAIIAFFKCYPLAVEFRHRSWSDDKHIGELLEENNVAWVKTDEPRFPSSVAEELPVTSDISYFRFHGRNREMWWKGDAETRYKYLYSDEELEELAQKVKTASEKAKQTFVFFNNHWQGYAPRNAIKLLQKLNLPRKDVFLEEKPEEKQSPLS